MKFKINLKPVPATPYFTVQEHLSAFPRVVVNVQNTFKEIEKDIKSALNLASEYHVYFIARNEREQLIDEYQVVLKDDPVTGIDLLKVDSDILGKDAILDLSYSLPQVPLDTFRVHSVILDPAVSLGVPTDFLIFMSDLKAHKEHVGSSDVMDERYVYLLERVLKDYLNKGKEVLLRESNYKAAVLYQMMEDSKFMQPVCEKALRSKTMAIAQCDSTLPPEIEKMGYEVSVVKSDGETQIAIANYPTHSKELIEAFADRVLAL